MAVHQDSTYIGNSLPRQKISYKEKISDDYEWAKRCVNVAISMVGAVSGSSRRSPASRKQRNYNLFNGRFDKNDMAFEIQPLSLQGFTFPAELQYRDIVSPIFTLLFGEEIKRGCSFVVRAVNDDAISSKEEKQKNAVLSKLQEFLTSENPEDPQEALKKVQKYYTYEYQDMREKTASDLLTYLRQSLKLDQEFSKGWEDVLLAGEEIYEIDIISGQPIARRKNPLETGFLLSHNSDQLDDADLIVVDTFMPVGQVIDEYWETLSTDEIDDLESAADLRIQMNEQFSLFPQKDFIGIGDGLVPESHGAYLDDKGNVRVTKVIWKSRKKIGELTYMDENNEQQKTYVDEDYKGNKQDKDETVDWFWINEYWETTRLKKNIYKNIRPRRLQFREMDNISKAKSGFVGTVCNANNAQSVSLMDRLVPWIYLYITLWYRTELLMAANQGKIATIDLSLIPAGWEVDKWMYYASIMKFAFVDSFNEGQKGASTGKLAGNIADHNKSIDLETGNSIQHYISLLDYIENKIHDLSGVSRQRLGAINTSEGVGNVQRSVTQSAIITEKWFQVHNWTKQRVLEQLIETAKVAYGEDKKKLQYVTDDLGSVFFSFDGAEFTNDQYGVFVSDSIKDQQVLEAVKQLAQAALQNDKTELSAVVDVMTSNSTAEVKHKLKEIETEALKREQQQIQHTQEMEKAAHDQQERMIQRDDYNKEADRQVKLQVAEMTSLGIDKAPEESIKETAKLALDERKQSFIEQQAQKKDSLEQQSHNLKDKELNINKDLKTKEIQSKEKMHKDKLVVEKIKAKSKPSTKK